MPARVRKIRHDEETRAKIQAAQIINRLQGCVMGTIELTQNQIRAAEILLRKTLPDLQSVEITSGAELIPTVSRTPLTDEEWLAQNGGTIVSH